MRLSGAGTKLKSGTIIGGRSKLLDQDLNKIWQKKYSAHSRNVTFGGAYGYDGMIKKALNKILDQIQCDFRDTQIRTLLKSQ